MVFCNLTPSSSSKIFQRFFSSSTSPLLTMTDENMRSNSLRRPARSVQASISCMVLFLLSFISLPCLFLTSAEAVCNPRDQESLLWFSGNVSSPASPLNWSSSIDCCLWEGITCDDSPNSRVTAISLPSKGLSGNLPPSIMNLHHLSFLNLSHNSFSGTLPTGLFSILNQLLVLDLSYNGFKGQLPLEPALGNDSSRIFPIQTVDLSSNLFQGEIPGSSVFLLGASNLSTFNCSNNSFTGPIPSLMCTSSPRLRLLDFSYNGFSGELPPELGKCLELSALRAGFNHLSGLIPSEIYNLFELEQIFLPANHLSGKIDDSITGLKKLTMLELYANRLEGQIPTDIGKLSNLRSLHLHNNSLNGSIPLSLVNCTNLVSLKMMINNLTGELSELNFSRLQSLSVLDLGRNGFTGDFPRTLYSCKSLRAVRLAANYITRQISPEVLALESLSFMSLYANNLTNITGALSILQGCRNLSTLFLGKNFYDETVPGDEDFITKDGFPSLQVLAIGGCGLKGEIPAWLIKLNSLQVIRLEQNRLVGSIPGRLGNLPNLFYIDLSDNLLSGELPKELFQLKALMSQKAHDATNMNYLELPVFNIFRNIIISSQVNQLSGMAPAIIINRNNLAGSLPAEIGRLKILHKLELSHNNLSGNIPYQFSNLKNLERLDLSHNNLSGQIPSSLKGLHFLSLFNVANNNLHGPIPTGGQFNTFPRANFEGNPSLCGPVLERSCADPAKPYTTNTDEEEFKTDLAIAVVIGFVWGASLSVYFSSHSGRWRQRPAARRCSWAARL